MLYNIYYDTAHNATDITVQIYSNIQSSNCIVRYIIHFIANKLVYNVFFLLNSTLSSSIQYLLCLFKKETREFTFV